MIDPEAVNQIKNELADCLPHAVKATVLSELPKLQLADWQEIEPVFSNSSKRRYGEPTEENEYEMTHDMKEVWSRFSQYPSTPLSQLTQILIRLPFYDRAIKNYKQRQAQLAFIKRLQENTLSCREKYHRLTGDGEQFDDIVEGIEGEIFKLERALELHEQLYFAAQLIGDDDYQKQKHRALEEERHLKYGLCFHSQKEDPSILAARIICHTNKQLFNKPVYRSGAVIAYEVFGKNIETSKVGRLLNDMKGRTIMFPFSEKRNIEREY